MHRIIIFLILIFSPLLENSLIAKVTIPSQISTSFIDHDEALVEDHKEIIPRLLLITGCCYSGTEYMSKFLRASGLDIEHEYMGNQGIVSWVMAANLETPLWGPLLKDYQFVHTFHQVRDPIKVIQSAFNFFPYDLWSFIYDLIPEIKPTDPLLDRAVKYCYYWNLLCEEKADWTYRIEDLDNVLKEFGEKLCFEFDEKILQSIDKNTNKKLGFALPITWAILEENIDSKLYKQISDLSIKYGYKIN